MQAMQKIRCTVNKINKYKVIDRVEEVKRYLATKNISTTRIQTKGYGPTRPIAPNTNEESRKLNRRVEFTILKM